MMNFRVSNYLGVRNQFLIEYLHGSMLQSYKSIVAVYYKGRLYLGRDHDYSFTTNKYMKKFTNLTAPQRRNGLLDGSIQRIETLPDSLKKHLGALNG